ncbi:MAG: hypothetical protein RLZZ219_261 [Cyanobacteriota bacterium]
MSPTTPATDANLFIFGCPRSGTTLLAELVNCHRQALVLIERHGILNSSKQLSLASYNPACVSDYAALSCEHQQVNTALLNRLQSQPILRYGDKLPKLYEHQGFFDQAKGREVTFVATLRNVFDVCLSYVARLRSAADPWSYSLEDGVRDWNTYVSRVRQIARDHRVLVFDYDAASRGFLDFDRFIAVCKGVYEAIGLATDDACIDRATLEEVYRRAHGSLPSVNPERAARRLSPEEMRAIVLGANFSGYVELLQMAGDRICYPIETATAEAG